MQAIRQLRAGHTRRCRDSTVRSVLRPLPLKTGLDMRNQPCGQGRASIDVDAVLGEFFACVERIGNARGRDRPPLVVGNGR